MTKEIVQTIGVLRQEVEVLTERVKQAGTGHLITAIDVINGRIDELMLEAIAPMLDEPVNRKAVTQEEMRKFYNDGPHIGARENDDGTWDMSAAARMETKPNRVRDAYLWSANKEGHWSPNENIEEKHTPDDVEHTEEYYDKNRNRAVETLL